MDFFGGLAAPRPQATDSDDSNSNGPDPVAHRAPSPVIPKVSNPEAVISVPSTAGFTTPQESSPGDTPSQTDSPQDTTSTAALLASKDEAAGTAPKPVFGPLVFGPQLPGFDHHITKADKAHTPGPEVESASVAEKGSSGSDIQLDSLTLAGSEPTKPESEPQVDESKPADTKSTAPELSDSTSNKSKSSDAALKNNNLVDLKPDETKLTESKPTDSESADAAKARRMATELAIFKACPVEYPFYPEETYSGLWNPWKLEDPSPTTPETTKPKSLHPKPADPKSTSQTTSEKNAPAPKKGKSKIAKDSTPKVTGPETTADESVNPTTPVPDTASRRDKTMLLFARLMEGGKEDEEIAADLAKLTKLLAEEPELTKQKEAPIVPIIDADCLDTLFGYLDMRQAETIRARATTCTAAYLIASGLEGKRKVNDFFHARMERATYDDYIVVFCAATAIFPLEYDLMAELLHIEGFLPSLGPLMTRKWKSKKIEMACLQMLHAATTQVKCLAAVYKYCNEWLDDIIAEDIQARVDTVWDLDTDLEMEKAGADELQRHCKAVRALAGVVYMKISAAPVPASQGQGTEPRKPATDKIEFLYNRFAKMIVEDNPENPEYVQYAVEALAYASLRPNIQERLARDTETLKHLVTVLASAAPKSPLAYGALSIFTHLTRYRPNESEEQKRMRQLKAYANAAGKSQPAPDPLSDDARVTERCKLVFAAGVVPVLVKHCKAASLASLTLIISILFSLSVTPALRGSLAQQGAVRVLLATWNALPAETQDTARRTAAHGLARILISTNPALVFRQTPQTAAIRPLAMLIAPADPTAETRDLLPTFESLLALTNLASTDDDADTTRRAIVRTAWNDIEEQLFSTNTRVSTATAELLCNLVQSPAVALALFGDDPAFTIATLTSSPSSTTPAEPPKTKAQAQAQATNRTKIILALADADSPKTRSAAGGALASLTAHASIARTILTTAAQPRGLDHILGLCREGQEETAGGGGAGGESAGAAEAEGIRHRGAVVVANLLSQEGELGRLAREKLAGAGAVEALTVCAKMSRTPEVVQTVVHCLEVLLGGQ